MEQKANPLPEALARLAVTPTPARTRAHPDFTGRDMTIALLDSGFRRHPDLTEPENRVLACVDSDGTPIEEGETPEGWQWHGTQTSVVAAGNGHLSDGLYRSLAPEAKVVLVRIGERGRISDADIAKGILWVLANRERYDVRILSISAGGDRAVPYLTSVADQAAEEAVDSGIVVVAAAGNAGFERNHLPMPPANAPSVVTVGGYDDNNSLDARALDLYRSSFGPTVDGLLKPEILAPAAWVAAPILPGTPQKQQAEALCTLAATEDAEISARFDELAEAAGLDAELAAGDAAAIRAAIEERLRGGKVVTPHYQHVDGTSFAAPIVASVVAQMLDANPDLQPHAVKHILLTTADRIPGASLVRQGYGILNAYKAVYHARHAPGGLPDYYFRPPHREGESIVFFFMDSAARSVALAGVCEDRIPIGTTFDRLPNGLWRAQLPLPPEGIFRYKFVVDGSRWVEDPNNWLKVDDGDGGLASVLYL
jgi:serine protease AprX